MRMLFGQPGKCCSRLLTCLVVFRDIHLQTVSCAGLCLNAWLVCGKKV